MKIRIIKIHKCSVNFCNNPVHIKGVFCKTCLNKIVSYSYDLYLCQICNNLIEIKRRKIPERDIAKRIKPVICCECSKFFDFEIGNDDDLCE